MKRHKAVLEEVEQRCKELERMTDNDCGELKNLREKRHGLEDEVLKLVRDTEALRFELKSIGAKAAVEYKESRGFQFRPERMGQVTYEFGYCVALACFWVKYLDLVVEEDPFIDQPEDTSMQMEAEQPFDDSLPPED
ncbi:hypothetical protein GW17_00054485 [Ensete ventricosum]|nr:hypothetical protein GW17_00054485 [Ensete ventricosum]RZR83856.1 hypothetical protein BHM03_00010574 [Ensete ventricosum]